MTDQHIGGPVVTVDAWHPAPRLCEDTTKVDIYRVVYRDGGVFDASNVWGIKWFEWQVIHAEWEARTASIQDDKGRSVPVGSDGKPVSYESLVEYAKQCPPVSEWED